MRQRPSEIGHRTDVNGRGVPSQKRRRLAQMRHEQSHGRWRSKAKQNLTHGLGKVRRLSSALDLSETLRDQACQLFWSTQNEDLLSCRAIAAMSTASVYGARRGKGRSQLLEDIRGDLVPDAVARSPIRLGEDRIGRVGHYWNTRDPALLRCR